MCVKEWVGEMWDYWERGRNGGERKKTKQAMRYDTLVILPEAKVGDPLETILNVEFDCSRSNVILDTTLAFPYGLFSK